MHKLVLKSATLACLVLAGHVHAAERTYALDPAHTQVDFRWNHMGFSHPAASISISQGTLKFDPEAPTRASVELSMPIASINTRVPDLDKHMLSADFFDAAKFPTATFKSTRVEQADSVQRFRIHGDLTIKGVTRPVVLDATLNKVGVNPMMKMEAIGFDATTTINRSAFGIGAFLQAVPDTIEIRVTTEGHEAAAMQKAAEAK